MARKNNTKSILFWIFLSLNIIVAIPLLLAFMAQYIPPSFSGLIVCCGIGFLYILLVNICFIVFWIFFNYRYCLVSLILALMSVGTIDKHYQFKAKELPETCPNTIKVMSYNAQLFGLYREDDITKRDAFRDAVFQYLRETNPDIACFQEFFWDKSETLNFHTTDSILSIMGLEDKENAYYQYFTSNIKHKHYFGIAVFSKYRIIHAEPITTDSSSNSSIYVDIKYRSDTIRIYNLHLTSLHMNKRDYAVSEQITTNNMNDPAIDKHAKKLYRKITESSVKREKQAKIIAEHIKNSPYPVIVCGDFNDPPASYCYNKIARNLKDAFRESGEGTGYTYHGVNMPHYRIDYILHSKQYNSYGFQINKTLSTSDHYPIFAYISLISKR